MIKTEKKYATEIENYSKLKQKMETDLNSLEKRNYLLKQKLFQMIQIVKNFENQEISKINETKVIENINLEFILPSTQRKSIFKKSE